MSDLSVVRWRVPGGSAANCLLPAPAQNLGFIEAKEYVFEKPNEFCLLRIDDEPLSDLPGEPNCWVWSPGFFAGEVTAELVGPTGGSTLFLLDVAPDPTKVGRDVFDQMVRELLRDAPSLVMGSEPAITSIGDLGTEQDLWLEFARLRRHAPRFLAALGAITAKPRRALFVRRASEPLHHVRRVDRHTAIALARSAAAAALFADNEALSIPAESRLDVPFVAESLDSSANRAMLALLLAVSRRTRVLEAKLQAIVEREAESETRTPLRTRWPVRRDFLAQLAGRLLRCLRRTPWTAVTRPEITAAGLNAVSADPAYARGWSLGWRALRHGVQGDQSTDCLWVSPSWEIYERWCFIRLGRLLSAEAPEWDWSRFEAPHRWIGQRGDESAELRLQPTFRSQAPSAEGSWSVSKERVPDFVMIMRGRGKVRFAVLDAKYRASRANVLDAMESAHIYQDSLRIGAERPRVSLLLIPAGGGAPWLEKSTFHVEHRVGCQEFSLGEPSLPLVLRDLLEG